VGKDRDGGRERERKGTERKGTVPFLPLRTTKSRSHTLKLISIKPLRAFLKFVLMVLSATVV
jgi:hypothetical protein